MVDYPKKEKKRAIYPVFPPPEPAGDPAAGFSCPQGPAPSPAPGSGSMRHAFPSAFQTLGLNSTKYNGIIEVLGQIYAWVVCLMFAAVVILVFLGL